MVFHGESLYRTRVTNYSLSGQLVIAITGDIKFWLTMFHLMQSHSLVGFIMFIVATFNLLHHHIIM